MSDAEIPDAKGGQVTDLLGIKPIGDAINTITKTSVEGAVSFLGRICNPAADELGQLFADKVRAVRVANTAVIANLAEEKVKKTFGNADVHAHPRLVMEVVEKGSWIDDDHVRQLWAGLLASSCSVDVVDDGNLMFTDLLGRITTAQARLFEHVCRSARKDVDDSGLVGPLEHRMPTEDVLAVMRLADIHRVDRELDYLRTIGVLGAQGGFRWGANFADVTPSALALQLYVRCQGWPGDPVEFWGLERHPPMT